MSYRAYPPARNMHCYYYCGTTSTIFHNSPGSIVESISASVAFVESRKSKTLHIIKKIWESLRAFVSHILQMKKINFFCNVDFNVRVIMVNCNLYTTLPCNHMYNSNVVWCYFAVVEDYVKQVHVGKEIMRIHHIWGILCSSTTFKAE